MKKVAIFVEGQTEQVFTTELVRHIFGHAKVDVEAFQFSGKSGNRKIKIIRSTSLSPSSTYYFRIYDCHGGGEESTVRSDINDQILRLQEEKFSYVIGLRDVFPLFDAERLKKKMNDGLQNSPISTEIFLAVQEIEAWFIAEEKHYSSINNSLTISDINSLIGFDITINTTESIPQPSLVLKRLYQSAGLDYKKKKWESERTVYVLNYDNLYLCVRNRNNSLNEFLTCIDRLIP